MRPWVTTEFWGGRWGGGLLGPLNGRGGGGPLLKFNSPSSMGPGLLLSLLNWSPELKGGCWRKGGRRPGGCGRWSSTPPCSGCCCCCCCWSSMGVSKEVGCCWSTGGCCRKSSLFGCCGRRPAGGRWGSSWCWWWNPASCDESKSLGWWCCWLFWLGRKSGWGGRSRCCSSSGYWGGLGLLFRFGPGLGELKSSTEDWWRTGWRAIGLSVLLFIGREGHSLEVAGCCCCWRWWGSDEKIGRNSSSKLGASVWGRSRPDCCCCCCCFLDGWCCPSWTADDGRLDVDWNAGLSSRGLKSTSSSSVNGR